MLAVAVASVMLHLPSRAFQDLPQAQKLARLAGYSSTHDKPGDPENAGIV